MKKLCKKITLLLLAAILCMVCAACSKPSGQGGETKTTGAAVQTTAAAQTETAKPDSKETEAAGTAAASETTEASRETVPETEAAAKETEAPETETPAGPVYYTFDDIDALKNTKNFTSKAIEHIFNGTINSNGNGSGYHYDMVEGSDGKIIEGTRSKEDKNGLYTADVEVDGHRKYHYSTFFPDSWSPQDVIDAINVAMKDAQDNDRHDGDTWIGYYGDIEINMYFNTKGKIVSAYPIYEDDKH